MESDDDLIIVESEKSLLRLQPYNTTNTQKQTSLFSILSSIDHATTYKNVNWPLKEASNHRESIFTLESYSAA